MTNMMTQEEFEMRLNLEIEIVKKKFVRSSNRSKFFGSNRRTTTEKEVSSSVRRKDGYTGHIAGDKWLSEEEYIQIVAFRSFIVREQFLTDDKIELLVRCCDKEFPVLNDLLNRLPDAIDELRVHGSTSVAIMLKQRRYIDTKMEDLTIQLP